uniref:ATP synthase mitochondrial F1 complex assembly factor 1-like n=1 Tax=Phallusia mammillata TaxID=59560 RepID=A0A6F9D7V2_9ASCI|nr:ATP synthase mitochondrial F1 complex assembly factor 1-like [Phallusia mammillata]
MNDSDLFVKKCLAGFCPQLSNSSLTMNVHHRYVRLFPSLLGSPRAALFSQDSAEKLYSHQKQAKSNNSATDLESNPYYQKYADKINKLKMSNSKEYERRIKLMNEQQEKPSSHLNNTNVKNPTSTFDQVKEKEVQSKTGKRKTLDSILKLELVNSLTAEEIGSLWVDHYSNKDAVSAIIPKDVFHILQTTAQMYPLFVYPVPRKDGYEMFVGQFGSNDFYFTSLINYQRHQENAPSQLTLNHYTELLTEKGIVLMSAMVTDDQISVPDAQLLSYLVQYFHTEHPKLLRDFNFSPKDFDFQTIIEAMNSGLAARAGVSVHNEHH